VPAEPTSLVRNGIFQGFLMSRSPIAGFERSNGHGRRTPGNAPVARMGSLIVRAQQPKTRLTLRQLLIDEARRQGLAYGMVVDEITGGFTLVDRSMPNAFKLSTDQAWRVYVDGRPDERVRGVDLVGTPLAAFSHVLAAGDEIEVFNGVCGAESGWVPVSAAGPPLLVKRLEFQLEDKEQEKPPLLSKPATTNDDGASDLDAEESP
jgi:TldD protein